MTMPNQQQKTGWGSLNTQQQFGIGSGLGSLFGLFGGGMNYQDPSKAAMPYLNQIPDIMKQYYNPYINAGMGAMGTLQGQYQNLLNDPAALMNKLGAGYKQSPGYQFNVNEATRGANQAAAAGGMVGSPAEQAQLSKTISGYADQDYNQYLQNAMGLYGQGLSGENNLFQTGYGASTGLAQNLSNALMSQANLAYSGAANQNQSQGGMWGGLGGLLGGAASLIPW